MAEGKRTRIPRAQAQEIILNAAEELFYQEGVRAVSIDAVVERAGINKMSVYRQFSSKTELILAYIARKQQAFWTDWANSMAKHPGQPREQLIQFFRDLVAKTTCADSRGCCFLNVAVEFPDPAHPVRQLVAAHQQRLHDTFLKMAVALGAVHPPELAYTLRLLMEGAYADSQTYGTENAAIGMLPAIVEKLIDSSLPQ